MNDSSHIHLPLLWHYVPATMHGNELWPLKALADIDPELAKTYQTKYQGREHIAQLHVPILDCGWNETIFLSPIHPQLIADALQQANIPIRSARVYQIPSEALTEHEAVWFDPLKAGPNGALTPESVSAWDSRSHRSLPLSEHALPYYQRVAANRRRPLLLATEPHILVRGFNRDGTPHLLSLAHAEIIETRTRAPQQLQR